MGFFLRQEKYQNPGKQGEGLSVRFLQSQGFRILSRNVRYPCGEIDIVALRDDILYFFEVKLRGQGSLVLARESLSAHQQKRIARAAQCYLQENESFWKNGEPACSFGLIAIDVDGEQASLEYIEDIF